MLFLPHPFCPCLCLKWISAAVKPLDQSTEPLTFNVFLFATHVHTQTQELVHIYCSRHVGDAEISAIYTHCIFTYTVHVHVVYRLPRIWSWLEHYSSVWFLFCPIQYMPYSTHLSIIYTPYLLRVTVKLELISADFVWETGYTLGRWPNWLHIPCSQ